MKPPIEKNKEYEVEIIDNGFEGEGIAKIENFTIFVPGAIKGEKIKILIVKVLSSHAYGKIIEILKKSENRTQVECNTYKRCGGCNMRHIEYEETLNIKQNAVQSLVNKSLKNKIEVKKTVAMGNPYHYRNKLQYPVGVDKEGKPIIGVFANRTHEIIPVEKCFLQNEKAEEVAKKVLELIREFNISVYNEETKKGLFRHIVIKTGIYTGEIMVILVINGKELPKEKEIVKRLVSYNSKLVTIVKNINTKNTNVILGKENINIYGNGYIYDILGDYKFKISAMSFYQVNPVQAEALYNIAIQEAEISKDDVVFDLYCGIGTISIFMAKYAKKVYGIEIVEEAIEDAKENAKTNNIENTEFIAGDVEVALSDLIDNKKIIPDVVIVDPPRKGLDKKTISNLLKVSPKRIVYISCNPASLVRDLASLEEHYNITSIQPVDLFSFCHHVECVAVLSLR